MPTLIASAPASISALAPSRVATLPAMTWTAFESFLTRVTLSSTCTEWPWAVSTTIDVAARVDQRSERSKPRSPGRGRGGDAQAALLVLGGVGIGDLLLDVLDGDQADAAVSGRRRRAASRCGTGAAGAAPRPGSTPSRTVIRRSLVISSETGWSGFAREAHVAVGEDADELALASRSAALDHRNARDVVALHQSRARRRASRRDGW